MSKEWWYVVSHGKVQIMVYYETKKRLTRYEPYLFSEYYKQSSGSLIAQQFMVEDGSPQQKALFQELGLTERHRDHSVRKPVIRGGGEDEDEAEAV